MIERCVPGLFEIKNISIFREKKWLSSLQQELVFILIETSFFRVISTYVQIFYIFHNV